MLQVGRFGWRAGVEIAVDTIEPGVNLRSHIEIRIGERFAAAILKMGPWIALLAYDPHHGAAVVLGPYRLDRSYRVDALIPPIAIDRRRREHTRRTGIGQQSGQKFASEWREHVFFVLRYE